jgi:hypothetical protein
MYLFYVPCVRDDSAIFVMEHERSLAEHLVDDERPLPQGRELVSVLVALDSSEH